jgi:hypothetical protein
MLEAAFAEIRRLLEQAVGLAEGRLGKKEVPLPKSLGESLVVTLRSKFRGLVKELEARVEILAEETLAEHALALKKAGEKSLVRKEAGKVPLRHQHKQSREGREEKSSELEFKNFQEFLLYIHEVNKVKSLELKFNSFGITDNGSPHLGNTLLKYTGLQQFRMNLGYNSIGEEGIERIALSLTKLEGLEELEVNLMYNRIKTRGVTCLFRNVCLLRRLTRLRVDLSSNFIGPRGLDEIGRNCLKLPRLAELELVLYENELNDESMRRFITHLESMWQLRAVHLDLRVNQISKTVLAQLATLAKDHKIDRFDVLHS